MDLFRRKPPSLVRLEGSEQKRVLDLTRRASVADIDPTSLSGRRQLLKRTIQIFEETVREEPEELVYLWMLADYYARLHMYEKSVQTARRAYELRPDDPRSTYALGTCLRELTYATYEGTPKGSEIERFFAHQAAATHDPQLFKDLRGAKRALEALGLTVEDTARQSYEMFKMTLELGVRREDARHVEESLSAMAKEFPHLSEQEEQ